MRAFEKNLKTAAEKIKLRTVQKRELRERLVSYMAYHPMLEATPVAKATKITSEQFFYIDIKGWQWRSLAGAAVFLIVAGVPAVAERAVPGDVLYPVKVRVNEEVLSQLSIGSYEKMEWEARRVERRIAEARLLAKEGKLTLEVEAQITETVKEHTASAEKELALLRESDADEAEVAQLVFESTLDVQSAMLANEHPSSTESIGTLAAAVDDAKATLTAKVPMQASLSSYERFLKRTDESVVGARDVLLSIESTLTQEERGDIDRRLSDIGRRVAEAQSLFGASSTKEAIDELKDAMRRSQKLIAFMTDIEVRNTVAIETLVPKELTLEERRAVVMALGEELTRDSADVRTRLEISIDTDLNEKIEAGLEEIGQYQRAILSALAEGGTLETGESAIIPARALMADLMLLTEQFIQPVAEVVPDVLLEEATTTATSTDEASTIEVE